MTLGSLRIIAWIVLYLSVLEVGLEVRSYFRGWDTLFFGTRSRIEGTSQTEESSFGPNQAFPFRSAIVPLERQPGKIRYWIASSSHAEDTYLSPNLIFPTVLEELLGGSGIRATVLNASRAGHDIRNNIGDLKQWGPTWKPDFVILYQMSTSINVLSKRLLSGASIRTSGLREEGETISHSKPSWPVQLIESTSIYAQLKANVASRVGTNRILSVTLGDRGDREFERSVREFIRTVRTLGSVPVLCTFATSHVRKDLPAFPDPVVTSLFQYNAFLSLEGWVYTVERFNGILRRIASEDDVILIDLEGVLAGKQQYFRDFVHFTPQGHVLVAQAMRDALLTFSRTSKATLAQGAASL